MSQDLKPCPCGRPVALFRFYDDPTEAGAHVNIDCTGFAADDCPLNLSLTRDVAGQQDVDDFMNAWNRRAEGAPAAEADIPLILGRAIAGEHLSATEQSVWTGYEVGWRDGRNDALSPPAAEGKEEAAVCGFCRAQFPSKTAMADHVAISHGPGDRTGQRYRSNPAPAAEPVATDQEISLAAWAWRNEKDRETDSGDQQYFLRNWRSLPGLRSYVEAEVAKRPPQQPVAISREEIFEALATAYLTGCRDTHEHYQPDPDPQFGEAANDYASAALDRIGSPSPVVGGAK